MGMMAKDRGVKPSPPEQVISFIGPGMRIQGDCDIENAIRIEGVVQGNIRAGKAVVVGKDGRVEGDIFTQDAVISGTVKGTLRAESRLEVQASSQITGEVLAGSMQLEEGAVLNGTIKIGKGVTDEAPPAVEPPSTEGHPMEEGAVLKGTIQVGKGVTDEASRAAGLPSTEGHPNRGV
jgi:cytoskeletal protein CcmA (bactofilin family)